MAVIGETVLTGKDGPKPDEGGCAQMARLPLILFGAEKRRAGGHALYVSGGRSVKAARSSTKGATIYTQYIGMTEARGARVHVQAKLMVIISACESNPLCTVCCSCITARWYVGNSSERNYKIRSQNVIYKTAFAMICLVCP